MASKTGGGSGSGKSMVERGKGPEYIWPKYGEGNENRVKKAKTLDEEDEERCGKLTLNWEGRLSTEEMRKYPPPPPDTFTDGRSQRVQTAAAGYWQNMKEGSILRRWIALLILEGKEGQTAYYYNELRKVQKLIVSYAEIIATEVVDFDFEKFHSYMFQDIKVLPKKQAEGSSSKTKSKKRK